MLDNVQKVNNSINVLLSRTSVSYKDMYIFHMHEHGDGMTVFVCVCVNVRVT
jgi:hypothetical protein